MKAEINTGRAAAPPNCACEAGGVALSAALARDAEFVRNGGEFARDRGAKAEIRALAAAAA